MTIQEAIEKAIEGGWTPKGLNCEGQYPSWIKQAATSRSKFYERYFLDPLFWQSLGKALGWKGEWRNPDYVNEANEVIREECYECVLPQSEEYWKYKWHRFIDHLAEGKDAESFFETL